jgi:hypothetical protein
MRILFDAGVVNERGMSVAIFDYARHAEELLGHEVIIAHQPEPLSDPQVLARFKQRFTCIETGGHLAAIARQERADTLYRLISGDEPPIATPDVWQCNHVVFHHDRPQGDVYAYISEWLSDYMSAGIRPFVPHIVALPEPRDNLRRHWNIPDEAYVIGRHGGYDQFNLPFLRPVIERILNERNDLWFVFLNTRKTVDHPRVIYLPPVSGAQARADFVASCDAMLHGRKLGESFGLAMAEFLYFDKPVICWTLGIDQNHVALQPDPSLLYFSASDLLAILRRVGHGMSHRRHRDFRSRFSPGMVMAQFSDVFLSPDRAGRSLDERGLGDVSAFVSVRRTAKGRVIRASAELSIARARLSVNFPLRY